MYSLSSSSTEHLIQLPDRAAAPLWVATARYGLRPAPGGLALVQDLLNTQASEEHGTDLLRDSANAEVWAAHAVRAWSAQREMYCRPPALTNHDAGRLRDLRGVLERALAGLPLGRLDRFPGTARFTLVDAAEISWMPRGQGWRWLSGAVLGEILLSRQAGTWQRLKQCRNGSCRAAFYDSSWNMTGVWHDPGACGPARQY
jgi:predicted RNA-binding Zn ribbon-like protein